MSATLTTTHTCDDCGAVASDTFALAPFFVLPWTMPEGWTWLRGKYYCPSHTLSVADKQHAMADLCRAKLESMFKELRTP